MIAASGFLFSCNKDNSDDEEESIPFDYLNGKIAFSRNDGKIAFINADLKTIKTVDAEDKAGIWSGSVSLSPGGEKIAYSAINFKYSGGYQVLTMSASGDNYFHVTDPTLGNSSAHNFCPVWDPDGTHLFYINGAMNSGKIYTISAEGENNTLVTSFEAYGKISVSRDKNRLALAFSKGEFDIPGGISIYDIRNDSLLQITHNDSTIAAYSPAFSPDEQKIAFVQRHGFNEPGPPPYFFRILTVNVDGTDKKTVIELPFEEYIDDTYLTWSPDGTKLLFNYGSGLNGDYWSHIFLINTDGSGLIQITKHPGYDGAPSWVE